MSPHQTDHLGARPRQSSISPNSQSQHYWNRLGARPREHQYSTSATLPSHPHQDDDWASPVTRPQLVLRGLAYDESIEDESLQIDGGREGTGENLEAGINSAFLLTRSTDQALLAWTLCEDLLMEEERVQLGTRIKRKEKLIREERACKEEKEFQETAQNCVKCGEIIDAQQQESHPCHPAKCCICLEYLDDFIGCYEVPCGHKFHEECYFDMLHNNIDTCPLCRQPI